MVKEAKYIAYDPIVVSDESTVVAEYVPEPRKDESFQSEAELEREFIEILESQAYEYLPITSTEQLKANLRKQLELLNDYTFSDEEWTRFFNESISGAKDGYIEKAIRIQEDHVQVLRRDDGQSKNIRLIDKTNIHNNRLQVINQYVVGQGEGGARYSNRYDVTVLVNGLPMVHIELKRRGNPIREAFNQINRYQRDSFWAGDGLFEYVQIFVISNGTETKYYSNTTRDSHINEKHGKGSKVRTSNSYEFTCWWTDANNRGIRDLTAFARTFFAKHTLLNILTRFCVLDVDRKLLVMRPYQIVATERILQRIQIAQNYKTLGTPDAGGYVWHTTGSGKTLTSFKTAQLASRMEGVDKVLFVVDRKDLDYQTIKEYDRFEKGAANSNQSTKVLKRQLEDPSAKIIVTTIQKLSTFIRKNPGHPVFSDHVVIIFDECHRSQFGDMHTAITKSFKRYNIFGFTGTPIFTVNATSGGNPKLKTTEQAFGAKLHTYTILDAINDNNVLPFRMHYVNTIKANRSLEEQVSGIDTDAAFLDPNRIKAIVTYTRQHFDQLTKRNEHYVLKDKRVHGFNAIFATQSIEAARKYYTQFELQQADLEPDHQLKVAMIYSYAPNDDLDGWVIDDEQMETDSLTLDDRRHLDDAIAKYNECFGTNFDSSADGFQNYYKDVSRRMKNRDLDLLVVVNMFLTGFDATTMNTLFVDKNLKYHGLIQAYSRTNRILNSVKNFGNIVTFRNLEKNTNDALELFGNKDARGTVILKPYKDYLKQYQKRVTELKTEFPIDEPIIGEEAQKKFIACFGEILRLVNILSCFDEWEDDEILTPRESQDYQSKYLDLYAKFREQAKGDVVEINDDLVFEIELIKQVDINIDYILMLVEKGRSERGDGFDKEIDEEIQRLVESSPTLRSRRDLVTKFVKSVTVSDRVDEQWVAFIERHRAKELATIIEEERLDPHATEEYMANAFRAGRFTETGTGITKVLPKLSRFASGRAEAKNRVIQKLSNFFERFHTLISGTSSLGQD